MRTGTEITKRPRGRPRAFVTAEVLDRVRAVFMAKGFAAASLDELAAAAGLNRPSLYAAFGDKEQLYIATLRFYGAKSVEGLDAILDGPGHDRAAAGQGLQGRDRSLHGAAAPAGLHDRRHGRRRSRRPIPGSPPPPASSWRRSRRAWSGPSPPATSPRSPSPAARARMAGAIMYAIAIRARLGTKAGELKAFAASMVPAICA